MVLQSYTTKCTCNIFYFRNLIQQKKKNVKKKKKMGKDLTVMVDVAGCSHLVGGTIACSYLKKNALR